MGRREKPSLISKCYFTFGWIRDKIAPCFIKPSRIGKVDTENISTSARTTGRALSVLKDIDNCRNLNKGATVSVFVASATLGVFAFFLTLDLANTLELDLVEPWMQISIPYILTFIVWIFSFFLIMSTLYTMGIRDLGSAARYRLLSLDLSLKELNRLRRNIELTEFKHKSIFNDVIADLESAECAFHAQAVH